VRYKLRVTGTTRYMTGKVTTYDVKKRYSEIREFHTQIKQEMAG